MADKMADKSEAREDKSCDKVRSVDLSRVKNKVRRSILYKQEKHNKNKEKRDRKKKRKREEEELGDEASPKQVPRTIENTRLSDETIVAADDKEVLHDEESDELSTYFKCEVRPKVLLTTGNKPTVKTVQFVDALEQIIPNSEVRYRKGIDIKKIIPQAVERGFTSLVVVNENHKEPNGLLLIHLPDGPTAHFKLSSIKLSKHIKNHGRASAHRPEVILNNFKTRLGHSVARLLASLFPYDPQFQGRRCATFHNQRDFIFFRHHRYIFKNSQKTGLQELGPRFTLKLRSLQRGTFDTTFGQYEWIHKRKEMDTSRRKFVL